MNSQMGYYLVPFGVKLNVRILKAKMEGVLIKPNLQRVYKETENDFWSTRRDK